MLMPTATPGSDAPARIPGWLRAHGSPFRHMTPEESSYSSDKDLHDSSPISQSMIMAVDRSS
jgi:hypothetical protein